MPGNDLLFIGTTGVGGTLGDNTPDPADWLGAERAATTNTLHELQSTLTSSQTTESRHFIVDTARIGDGANVHALKWILFLTGPAAMEAARIESFDDSTGVFKLDRRTTVNAASGDDYAIFDVNNVWPDVTAAQARDGDTRYRCIFMYNNHGATLTNVRYHFIPLTAGGFDVARINQVTETRPFLERADDTTDILSELGQRDPDGGGDNFSGSSGWQAPFDRAIAAGNDASLTNGFGNAIWLRRSTPAGLRYRRSVAVLLVVSTDVAGSDPDPLLGGAIMAWNVDGVPAGTLARDRHVSVGGGARWTGTVTDVDGEPISQLPVLWRIRPGDPGSLFTDDDPIAGYDVTDVSGLIGATMKIATSATPGTLSRVQMLLASGDEIGDPMPPP